MPAKQFANEGMPVHQFYVTASPGLHIRQSSTLLLRASLALLIHIVVSSLSTNVSNFCPSYNAA